MRVPPLWRRGLVWLALLGPLFFASYGAANQWTGARAGVPSIVFGWERHIPFLAWTIVPYWSIDLFYAASLLLCRTRLELTRHGLRLLTAQVLCIAAFVLVPLRFSTPRPPVDGAASVLFQPMFDALAGFDLPFNQAPSLHIVLLLILWDFYRRRVRGWGKLSVHAWSALVGLSVLMTYQHHFIDIPTGLLAGAFCLWLWPLEGPRPTWSWTGSPARRRLAAIYAAAALSLALVAAIDRAAWWLAWPVTSLALVAACYAALGAEGFQKRADGRHSFGSRLLLWPYRFGAWLNARWWTRGRPSSVALDGGRVWLGRVPLPWERDHARFAQIVDLTGELSLRRAGVRSIAWLDLIEPSAAQLLQAARAVQAATGRGPVLVCCALGFSRSSAVAAVWLAAYGRRLAVDDAVSAIRTARPQVVLERGWLAAINEAVAMHRREASA
ncbi:MAG: phosphatase PAP2/dual specificity phosphatase family protein [Caldimonas sp.]